MSVQELRDELRRAYWKNLMMEKKTMAQLTIMAALHGGYVVYHDPAPGSIREILYCGSLEDCLHFIKQHLLASKNP